jgi:LPXTG-site transpeptidase (sortase) family protein
MISRLYFMLARILTKRWNFLWAFLLTFFITLSALVALGVAPKEMLITERPSPLPSSPSGTTTPRTDFDPLFARGEGEAPLGIEIPSVGVKANVTNPTTTDIPTLDTALLKGAVRYPSSARMGEEGNVLIFGHSSYLPVVHNQSFKAFNEISKLETGAPIMIYSNGRRYTYAVESVRAADVENDAISLTTEGALLTLVTCNSFGDKSDRFIVTASLVSVVTATQPAE